MLKIIQSNNFDRENTKQYQGYSACKFDILKRLRNNVCKLTCACANKLVLKRMVSKSYIWEFFEISIYYSEKDLSLKALYFCLNKKCFFKVTKRLERSSCLFSLSYCICVSQAKKRQKRKSFSSLMNTERVLSYSPEDITGSIFYCDWI